MVLLSDIKDTVKNIADAIASVLNTEVTIVDADLNRIAGTGKYRNSFIVPQNSIVEKCIRTGNTIVVTNPGMDQACHDCENSKFCSEKIDLCCPIILNDVVVGSIVIVTFDENRKQELINNQLGYLNFLHRMANLIASKLSEENIMNHLINVSKELETVIDNIELGVISVNSNLKVTMCNEKSCQQFDCNESILKTENFDSLFPQFEIKNVIKTKKGYRERKIAFYYNNKDYNLIANAFPIVINNICISIIITFQDYTHFKRTIHRIIQKDSNYLTFDDIIGKSDSIIQVINIAKSASTTDANILIYGESGTGKELFARAIHSQSLRSNGLFVAINCAAIPEALLESELFGYEEGSFTNAKKGGKIGMFELAKGGTIFLDEIGDMPLYLQVKLLRVIQERKIFRIGGTVPIDLDIRIISATNKPLHDLIKYNQFREDLFYRINVVPITLPPLRNRTDDLPLLIKKFIKKYNYLFNKEIKGLEENLLKQLYEYNWPGNIRELENMIEYGVIFEENSYIQEKTLSYRFSFKQKYDQPESNINIHKTLKEQLEEHERYILKEYLKKYGSSLQSKNYIAQMLDIGRTTLYRKLKKM